MSTIKFYTGSFSDLDNKTYEEGSVYIVFPPYSSGNMGGRIFLDLDGIRKEISSTYDDTNLLLRLAELERVSLVHCTGLSIEEGKQVAKDGTTTVTAILTPENITDQIF